MAKEEKPVGNQSALGRYLVNSGLMAGALGMTSKRPGAGALVGGLSGLLGTGAAEATGARRGGAGYSGTEGALTGGLSGAGLMATQPGGMSAVKYLMAKHGLSKAKAVAALLGGGAAVGGGIGGLSGLLGGGLAEALEE